MKLKITTLACVVGLTLQTSSTFAQWVNCPNTHSLHGYSLGVKGNDIYTGVQNGQIFKSTNDGASFSQNVNTNYNDITELFVSGDNIFARKATYTNPLYRSNNDGSSWQLKNAGLSWTQPAPFNLGGMAQIGNTLYIGTSNGVYQSTDGGDNWSEIAGNNWSTIDANNYVRVLKSHNGILYAGVSHGVAQGFYFSSDNGVTWTASGLGAGLGVNNIEIKDIAFSGNDVFVLSEYKIYRSVDNCATFTEASYGGRKMLAVGGKILIVGDAFEVYDIATATLVAENDGITSVPIFSVAIKGDNVFIGVQTHGLFKRPLSELGITVVAPTAPAAPSDLQASSGKTESATVNLTWTDNANNETGFKVERSTDGSNFTEIADITTADTQTYQDASANEGTTYHYRVLAYNTTGSSAFSNVAQTTTGTTGISGLNGENKVQVYPNPATNYLQFSETADAKLFGITGQLLMDAVNVNAIYVAGLPAGVYMLTLTDKKGQLIQRNKIVKE